MRGETPNAFTSGARYGARSLVPTIEADHVQHLPIGQAYADQRGVVEASKQWGPTEMAIDPGTVVLGMLLDTWCGRSPLSRLAEGFPHPETALLLGKAIPPAVFQDDTGGWGLERL